MFTFLNLIAAFAVQAAIPTAILVDKKSNQLHVAEMREGFYHVLKSFRATVGKVKGDKQDEGDLKTPEGIYIFTKEFRAPNINKKFGELAFFMDYPNAYDRIAGRTGSNILLHATNEPERLKKDYDSEGCVVLKNEELKMVAPFVRIGLTPILVFSELERSYLEPGKNPKLVDFFKNWRDAWSGKSIGAYIEHYHSDFQANGKNKKQWKIYKTDLAARYASIKIDVNDVIYYSHPKYSMITFHQDYHSTDTGGKTIVRSIGTKQLYVAEEDGKYKIISESFTNLKW